MHLIQILQILKKLTKTVKERAEQDSLKTVLDQAALKYQQAKLDFLTKTQETVLKFVDEETSSKKFKSTKQMASITAMYIYVYIYTIYIYICITVMASTTTFVEGDSFLNKEYSSLIEGTTALKQALKQSRLTPKQETRLQASFSASTSLLDLESALDQAKKLLNTVRKNYDNVSKVLVQAVAEANAAKIEAEARKQAAVDLGATGLATIP